MFGRFRLHCNKGFRRNPSDRKVKDRVPIERPKDYFGVIPTFDKFINGEYVTRTCLHTFDLAKYDNFYKKGDADVNDSKKQDKVDPKNDEDDDSEGGSDEDMMDADSDSPKKADLSKKRPNGSASKTPVSAQKAKYGTPEKKDAKKGGHPMKKGGKTPNSEAKEAKSGGQLCCKSCSKTFNSESGLQQHNQAKHGGQ